LLLATTRIDVVVPAAQSVAGTAANWLRVKEALSNVAKHAGRRHGAGYGRGSREEVVVSSATMESVRRGPAGAGRVDGIWRQPIDPGPDAEWVAQSQSGPHQAKDEWS